MNVGGSSPSLLKNIVQKPEELGPKKVSKTGPDFCESFSIFKNLENSFCRCGLFKEGNTMTSTIIECMSTRKLTYVLVVLLSMQVACFLIGAIISPMPNSSMQYLATNCIDVNGGKVILTKPLAFVSYL